MCVFTEESFKLDVSGDEIVEFHMSIFVAVSHHNGIERSIAYTVTCPPIHSLH